MVIEDETRDVDKFNKFFRSYSNTVVMIRLVGHLVWLGIALYILIILQ